MTLDEIEAEFLGVGDIDDAHATWWKEEYGTLLIRAVRQLGARQIALTRGFDSQYVLGGIEKYTPVDDDVLALLEEAQ